MATKTRPLGEELDQEQVRAFLEAHPDFLDRHPELLASMHFSHQPGDGAVSLIERQVQVLREEQQRSKRQFAQLAANAELNQRLLEKIQKFTIELLDCTAAQPMLSRAHHLLGSLFDLQFSRLLLNSSAHPELGKGIQRLDTTQLADLEKMLSGKATYMGRNPEWLEQLIDGIDTGQLGSIALVRLTKETGPAFLLLGSQDSLRFQDDMGSHFLDYIGALIGRLLDRLE